MAENNIENISINNKVTEKNNWKTIWLIRHAQSTANRDRIIQGHLDAPLTDLGQEQSHLTGLYFQEKQGDFQVENIFSSDLQRARQTAQNIASKINLTAQVDQRMKEAFFGRWEGVSSVDLLVNEPIEYKQWLEDKTWRPSWCESFYAVRERALSALQEIGQLNGNTIIVTHGGVLQALVHDLITEDSPLNEIKNSFSNCSITTLNKNPEGQFSVVALNFLAPNVPETKLKLIDALTLSNNPIT